MEREIVRNKAFLSLPSSDADRSDISVIGDLSDTLRANSDRCVGMAANMIGVRKNIICVLQGPLSISMINPVITEKSGEYVTREGCLSLDGERECTRYRVITVEYLDSSFRHRKWKFTGFTAEIIQHEIDHLHGILI